ncbi:MAG: hypothetical protein Q4D58_12310 [Synergistaceae bacterium]|nr:hypothetical protein [Synergistaceae bacterium]
MTYYGKLMSLMNIDWGALTEKQQESLARVIDCGIYNVCPGALFDGAPQPNAAGECESPGPCFRCWNQEAE